jgi:hypothetical protein
MPTPQQEPRERKEHRDGKVEPAEQPAGGPAGVTGLKRDVGHDDADRRARAHALDGGQETPGPAHGAGFGHADQCAKPIERWKNG